MRPAAGLARRVADCGPNDRVSSLEEYPGARQLSPSAAAHSLGRAGSEPYGRGYAVHSSSRAADLKGQSTAISDKSARLRGKDFRIQLGTAAVVERLFEISGVLEQITWTLSREEALNGSGPATGRDDPSQESHGSRG